MTITVEVEEVRKYQQECQRWLAGFLLWAPRDFFEEADRLNAMTKMYKDATQYDSTHKQERMVQLLNLSEAGKKWLEDNPMPKLVPQV